MVTALTVDNWIDSQPASIAQKSIKYNPIDAMNLNIVDMIYYEKMSFHLFFEHIFNLHIK